MPARSNRSIRALQDEESEVRVAAVEALGHVTGKDFGQDAEAWQRWWEERRE